MREGAWVGRAPAGSGSGRHVEEWGCRRLERRGEPLCCAADSPSSEPARGGEPRPVSLVRGRRSVHRPAARATVMKGGGGAVGGSRGSRRAYAAPPRASLPIRRLAGGASREQSSLVVVVRRRRLALHSSRGSVPAAAHRTYHTPPSRHPAQGGVGRAVGAGAAAVHRARARRLCAPRCGARRAWRSVWCVERRVLWGCLSAVLAAATACSFGVCVSQLVRLAAFWHWCVASCLS